MLNIPEKTMAKAWHGTLLFVLCVAFFMTSCGGIAGSELGSLVTVQSIKIVSVRGQHIAEITGEYPDSCSTTGRVRQEVKGSTLSVTVYAKQERDASCEPVPIPFRERIPLEVEGLSAGQYTVSVNGTVSTLTLLTDQ